MITANEKEIRELILDYRPCKYKNYATVLLVWKSPITNTIEKRSGCFDEHTEARLFGEMLKEKYSKTDMEFAVYLIYNDHYNEI